MVNLAIKPVRLALNDIYGQKVDYSTGELPIIFQYFSHFDLIRLWMLENLENNSYFNPNRSYFGQLKKK